MGNTDYPNPNLNPMRMVGGGATQKKSVESSWS